MKVLFLGTPEFACPTLQMLHDNHQVVGVICQPDRPRGRSKKLQPPPVKALAQELGLRVFQPEKLRKASDLLSSVTRELQPDILVVVAYGQILNQAWLEAAPLGALNIHASLLPKLRGAAPIQWSIARGDQVTGVTIMQMEKGLDSGPMLARKEVVIGSRETSAELAPRLSSLGAHLLSDLLEEDPGAWKPKVQDESRVTWAPLLSREQGRVDLESLATEIFNRWRGFQPWPGAWCRRGEKTFKLVDIDLATTPVLGEPGTLVESPLGWLLVCGQKTGLILHRVQAEGSKAMDAGDYFRGNPPEPGERLC